MSAKVEFAGLPRGAGFQQMTALFVAAGLETPQTDARWLLAHALGVEPLALVTGWTVVVTAAEAELISRVVQRRLAHEPVSRIIGTRWFYGRPFRISPATLDPRPDSESLVEAVLELVEARGQSQLPIRVLDIGTGTGCLLLSLLSELPNATGIGTDVSSEAIAVATDNADALGLSDRVIWRVGADFTPLLDCATEPVQLGFDVIISNPPYIATDAIQDLAQDVRAFDPRLALDGGGDGLDMYRRLAAALPRFLAEGWGVFEVGAGQSEAVTGLLQAAFAPALLEVRVFPDLGGVPRCVAVSPRSKPA
jgi:release factor glutamine methyltransferase